MQILPFATLLTMAVSASPALAEVMVTHSVEGRFGVSYVSSGNGAGRTQPLYEGRYTTTFAHQTDNGLRFRFDLGVIVGNIEADRSDRRAARPDQREAWRN